MSKDFYFILGISRGAKPSQIKEAYRKYVKRYHPDTAPVQGRPEKFLEIQEAYDTLIDAERRRKYDAEQNARTARRIRTAGVPERILEKMMFFNALDRFEFPLDEFFEGYIPEILASRRRQTPEKDLFIEVVLSTEEAERGGVFPIRFPGVEACPRCRMTGMLGNYLCPNCRGEGWVRREREFSLVIPGNVRHDTWMARSMEDIGLTGVLLNVHVLINE